METASEKKNYIFETKIDEEVNAEKVLLPESTEKELVSDSPESPLNLMEDKFRKLGILEQNIQRYDAAVKAFMKRPSAVTTSYNFSFSPQNIYFAPSISFGKKLAPLPDILKGGSLKPRIVKNSEGGLQGVAVDGRQVLNKFKGIERQEKEDPITGEKETVDVSRDRIFPEERWLVRLNRLMYAYHEPLHVMQSLTKGDRLNRWKEKADYNQLLDPDKEKEYLQSNNTDDNLIGHKPEWIEKSVLVLPNETGDKLSEDWVI